MSQRVFISYSRSDAAFASRLAADLRQHGIDVWIDTDAIHAGVKWSTAIQEGLKSSHLMILIHSPTAAESTNVEDEWQYFLDKKKSNTDESDLKRTTPVDRYPQGASPFGVMDMSGNLLEWCLNEFDKPIIRDITTDNNRVLRGGSWYDSAGGARAASRYYDLSPDGRGSDGGFRVCCGTVPMT